MCMTSLADTSTYEREANRSAVALLMPEDTVRAMLGACDVETAAERMIVSVGALLWRLRELGIPEDMMT